jgi:hypothetical protein
MSKLGVAVAMNAYKNGQLEVLEMKNSITNASALGVFASCMEISKMDHELMYGDQKLAN